MSQLSTIKESKEVSKTALLLLTFFLGVFGAHKFYLGKNWQGFFYLLFCWTLIPGLIALIEFISYAFTSSEVLQEKHTVKCGAGAAIAVVVAGGFVMLMLLATIVMPQFIDYINNKTRTAHVAIESELQNLAKAEKSYFLQHGQYSSNIQAINFTKTNPKITIEIKNADNTCYEAVGTHQHLQKPINSVSITIDCNSF